MKKSRTPAGPRLSSGEVVGWTPEKEAMAYNAEQKYGLPEGTLRGMAFRESQFGKLSNRPGSQYQGEFQLGSPIRKAGGVTNTRDFAQTSMAAAKYAAENQSGLAKALGRQPTSQELYLAHQQGLGGATKLLRNPNASAASQISTKFANANGGKGLTSKQFFDKHSRAFNEGLRQGDDALWNGKSSSQPGDKTQLAMRGDTQPSDLQKTMMAALEKGQQQPASDGMPGWAKTQIASVQNKAPSSLPPSDTLSRINPADKSGPLLPKPGEVPTQLADVMGKGIPASNMPTPGMNPKLDALPPTQLANIDMRGFGQGVHGEGMATPSMNPQLEQLPTQMAQLDTSSFGANVPTSNMATPSMNPQLEQPPMQMATSNAPVPPHRPEFAAPAPVQVAQASPVVQHMNRQPEPMLHQGGGTSGAPMSGGVEGMGSMSPIVAMNSPAAGGGEFDVASLFGDAFQPQQGQDPFMTADAGGFGGGDFGGGGFDLGGLFGSMFG